MSIGAAVFTFVLWIALVNITHTRIPLDFSWQMLHLASTIVGCGCFGCWLAGQIHQNWNEKNAKRKQ